MRDILIKIELKFHHFAHKVFSYGMPYLHFGDVAYLKTVFFNPSLPLFLRELKELAHSLKGISRAMDEGELSQVVHFFESRLLKVEKSLLEKSPPSDELEEQFFHSLQRIKNMSRIIILNSSLFQIINLKKPDLSTTKFYSLTRLILDARLNQEREKRVKSQKEIIQKIYRYHLKPKSQPTLYKLNTLLIDHGIKSESSHDNVIFYLFKPGNTLTLSSF